jgi:hypothetical protein
VKQATAAGGDILVVAIARAEVVTKLIIALTEPHGGSEALEASHISDAAFHAAVVLDCLMFGESAVHAAQRTRQPFPVFTARPSFGTTGW